MKQLELRELTALLRECAGEEDGVDLEGDVLDTVCRWACTTPWEGTAEGRTAGAERPGREHT